MRALYTSLYNIRDPKSWSGTIHFMSKGLQEQGIEIIQPTDIHFPMKKFYKAKSFLYKRMLKTIYFSEREPYVLKNYARELNQKIKYHDYDLIFSPQTSELAYLETKKPIVFWVDATFDALLKQLKGREKFNNRSIELGNRCDQIAFDKTSAAIFASDWAAKSAVDVYNLNPEKVHVVPFGANLTEYPSYEEINEIISRRDNKTLKIIFIAVNWEQKGGDIVVEIAKSLIKNNIKCELNVVGEKPRIKGKLPDFIKWHGYLSKSKPEDRSRLTKLLAECHIMVMPSRQEAFGLVLCEANAYGLPVFSSSIGGITTIVREGINGYLFDKGSNIDMITEKIIIIWNNRRLYNEMALSSYNEFTTRLNWKVSCQKVKSIMQQLI